MRCSPRSRASPRRCRRRSRRCDLRRSIPIFALLALVSLGETAAAATVQVSTEDETVVRIRIDSALETHGGYAPVRVGIANHSGRDRSWTFSFVSYGVAGSTRRTTTVLEVPSGQERSFDLVVPLATSPGEMSPLNVRVVGYGIEIPTWEYPLVQYGSFEGDAALALSHSLHAATGLGIGQPIDPLRLPSDWRGLVSIRTLALTEDELARASIEARTALLEWTARGGHLVRVGDRGATSRPYGLGTMVSAAAPSDSNGWAELLRAPSRPRSISYGEWAQGSVPPIETRPGLLLLFLVGYAVLVGPLNLFVFCARGKRARLFWTMPVLALAASFFLTAVILLQDGLGGGGRRVTFVRLVPELTREVVVQEQVSRTGALLSRGFEIGEPVALFDVATGTAPYRGDLVSVAGSFAGSWFRSRSIQAQRLELVRAGRARVEWAEEERILSSVESPLEELFYRDEDGRCWRAAPVVAGQEVALEPISDPDYEIFWQSLSSAAGPAVREHLYAAYWERGAFLARGRAPGSAPVETLRGIQWEDTLIYSGRIGGKR